MTKLQLINSMLVTALSRFRRTVTREIVNLRKKSMLRKTKILKNRKLELPKVQLKALAVLRLQLNSKKPINARLRSKPKWAIIPRGSIASSADGSTSSRSSTLALILIG